MGPAFAYHFAFRRSQFCDTIPISWGVTHGMEVPYVFANPELPPGNPLCSWSSSQRSLSKAIGAMWRQFAVSGAPTPTNQQDVWPTFRMDKNTTLRLYPKTNPTVSFDLELPRRQHYTRFCSSFIRPINLLHLLSKSNVERMIRRSFVVLLLASA